MKYLKHGIFSNPAAEFSVMPVVAANLAELGSFIDNIPVEQLNDVIAMRNKIFEVHGVLEGTIKKFIIELSCNGDGNNYLLYSLAKKTVLEPSPKWKGDGGRMLKLKMITGRLEAAIQVTTLPSFFNAGLEEKFKQHNEKFKERVRAHDWMKAIKGKSPLQIARMLAKNKLRVVE